MGTKGIKVKRGQGVKEEMVDNIKQKPALINLCDSSDDEEGGDISDEGDGERIEGRKSLKDVLKEERPRRRRKDVQLDQRRGCAVRSH